MSISLKWKKGFPKRKMPFFFILESLSNEQQLLLYHTHFNKYSYLKMEHHSSLPRPHLLLLKTHYFVHSWKKGRTISLHLHTIKKVHVYNSQKYSQKSYCINFFFISWKGTASSTHEFCMDSSGNVPSQILQVHSKKSLNPDPIWGWSKRNWYPVLRPKTENNGI